VAQRRFALINKQITGAQASLELSDLTDVNTSTPTNRNVLVADGTDWESRALVEADISDLQNYSLVGHTHVEADITDLGSYLENIVEDTTPQLGGNLDMNGFTIAGIAEANFLDKTATETVSGRYTFTATSSGSVGAITLESASPLLRFNETDATADEGGWDIGASNDSLLFRAINDARSAATTFIDVQRTGTTIDEIELNATTIDVNGTMDVSGALTAFSYGGILEANLLDKTATETITGQYTFESRVDIDDGAGLRVYDSTDTVFGSLDQTATNFQIASSGASNIQLISGGGFINVVTGSTFRVWDAGNTDRAEFSHDGTDFNTTLVNTTDWNISGARAVFDAQVVIDANPDTTGGTLHLRGPNNTSLSLQEEDATANNGVWDIRATAERLIIRALNDAQNAAGNAIDINRTGTTIDEIDLNATTIDINGAADVSGNLTVGGELIANSGGGQADPKIRFDNATQTGLYSNTVNELSITAGGIRQVLIDSTTFRVNNTLLVDETIFIDERAAAAADQAGKGQLWVRNDTPNTLIFTDDAGTDIVISNTSIGGIQSKFLATTTTAKTTDTTLADETDLSGFTLETGATYILEAHINYLGGSVPDIKMRFQFSNTPSGDYSYVSVDNSGTTNETDKANATATIVLDTINTREHSVRIIGAFTANVTTGGTMDFQWAQNTSSAAGVSLDAGCWIRLTRVV